MAAANVDKACCVNGDDALFILDKFLLISGYYGYLLQFLSFIYANDDENLFIHNTHPIKTSLVDKMLEAKIVTEYTTAEGDRLHAC
jgi:hypothetical protein